MDLYIQRKEGERELDNIETERESVWEAKRRVRGKGSLQRSAINRKHVTEICKSISEINDADNSFVSITCSCVCFSHWWHLDLMTTRISAIITFFKKTLFHCNWQRWLCVISLLVNTLSINLTCSKWDVSLKQPKKSSWCVIIERITLNKSSLLLKIQK